MKTMPQREYLLSCFLYADGALLWLIRPTLHFRSQRIANMWNAKNAGRRAGRVMPGQRYRQVGLDGARYLEHRIIAAMHGMCTDMLIDHRDGDGLNNRLENMRPATKQQNTRNNGGWRKRVAPTGIWQTKSGKWIAYIRENNKHKHIGTFESADAALDVRRAAASRVYGDFAFRGRGAEHVVTLAEPVEEPAIWVMASVKAMLADKEPKT